MRSSAALLLGLVLVISLALPLTGCGGVTTFGFKADFQSVSGTVSLVQLSTINANGTFIQVTFVTLQTNGLPNQFTFCDDHAAQFPMNTSVTVNFNPGQSCNQIVAVATG
jgi:hypothetical protein